MKKLLALIFAITMIGTTAAKTCSELEQQYHNVIQQIHDLHDQVKSTAKPALLEDLHDNAKEIADDMEDENCAL